MKKGFTLYIVIILVVIGTLIWLAFSRSEKSEAPITSLITYTNSSDNLIKVELPFPGAVVGKEFSVIGEARGPWFFEASFPIGEVTLVLKKDNPSGLPEHDASISFQINVEY